MSDTLTAPATLPGTIPDTTPDTTPASASGGIDGPDPVGAHLRSWIGREEIATDVVSADLVAKFNATLDHGAPFPEPGETAPRFIHFCLTQAIRPMRALGRDGHPERGGFLPPVPLPRRMRAGGEVVFHDDLRVGDRVTRLARIRDVVVKEGRSGALCFVTVENHITVDGRPILTETEDIVYRPDGNAGGGPSGPGRTPRPTETGADPGTWSRPWPVTTTQLFRYSAITFNGHRIHYDRAYAREVEGYPGLVVHGPLQTTMLHRFATDLRGTPPARFRFRGLSPVFDHDSLTLHAEESATGLSLWTARDGGPVATLAQAEWD